MRVRGTLPLLAPLAACQVHPAPEDLDSLMRTLWSDVTERRDDLLRRDLATIDEILDLDAIADRSIEGTQTSLLPEDVADITFLTAKGAPAQPPDISEAIGLHIIDRIPCTEAALLDVMLHKDQMEIYGSYDAYERTYDDDPEAFRNGEVDQLTWTGSIDATIPLAGTYTYDFRAEARRVSLDEGTGFLTRTWMPTPATWTKEKPIFDQDYQLEVWRPTADGEAMIHIYPVWRVMEALGFTMSDTPMQTTTLSQMAKWDRRTGELCTEGLHPAN